MGRGGREGDGLGLYLGYVVTLCDLRGEGLEGERGGEGAPYAGEVGSQGVGLARSDGVG